MLHVLAGALVGATVGAAAVLVKARLEGRPIDGAALGAMALAGLVAGGVGAATLGAGGAVAAGLGRGVVAGVAAGGAGGGTHRAVINVARGRPVAEGTLEAAATGAVVGGVTRGLSAGLAPLGDRLSGPLRDALHAQASASPLPTAAVTAAGDAVGSVGAAYPLGAAIGAARRTIDNAAFDRPLGEDVPLAAHEGGVDAAVRVGVGRLAAPAVGALLPSPAQVAQSAPPAQGTTPTQGLRGALESLR